MHTPRGGPHREQKDLAELSFLYFLWEIICLLCVVKMSILNSMHPTSPQCLLYFLGRSHVSEDCSCGQLGITGGTSSEVTQMQVQVSALPLTSVTLEGSLQLGSKPFLRPKWNYYLLIHDKLEVVHVKLPEWVLAQTGAQKVPVGKFPSWLSGD